jgi:1,4-alpha-glucan branching enzyme
MTNWVNPQIAGNFGGITADGPPLHGFTTSAAITIPANGVVVLKRVVPCDIIRF